MKNIREFMKGNMKTIKYIVLTNCIVIVLMFILLTTCFNKFGNYSERGNPVKHELVSGQEAVYRATIFQDLNTIITNEDFGIFVIQKNGKFMYFVGEHNLFDANQNQVYSYQGYWNIPRSDIRFTVTRTKLKQSTLNYRFNDWEKFCSMSFIDSGEMTYNDNILFDNIEFKVLDNQLTKDNERKLKLDDKVIEEFIKFYK